MCYRNKLIRLIVLAVTAFGLCACGLGSATLRKSDGTLAPCDGGPHCVSSQSTKDADRHVEPLGYSGKREDARKRLLAVLGAEPGFKLITSSAAYIHVEASTSIMRYVDDVEFVFARKLALIDVRSSSRIGYYDFKTNRNRVEKIRAAFDKPER